MRVLSLTLSSSFSIAVATWSLLVSGANAVPTEPLPVRIACIGDSITRGVGTDFPEWESYPAQLQRMLGGSRYVVGNFGVSDSTLLIAGNQPYAQQKALSEALAFRPDIVVIQLGTEDTRPENWVHRKNFTADYISLIRQFAALESRPRIWLCLPPAVRPGHVGINEAALCEQHPLIQQVAREEGLPVIDVHAQFVDQPALLPDGVHPNGIGALVLAKVVHAAVIGRPFESEMPVTLQTRWNDYTRLDFVVGGRPAILVSPKSTRPGRPWIWRTEFFGAFPAVDLALLARGWHVAYLNVQNLYGASVALAAMDKFQSHLQECHGLTSAPVLEGFSRGGLFAFNWAVRNPSKVAALYVDAPVCDFKSWPAGKGKGKGSVADWAKCLKAYGMTEEQALAYRGNPVDNLAPLAAAHIPIVAVAGDADDIVPVDENIGVVVERYRKLGGNIELILKAGIGHHPHSLEDPTPVVDFLEKHAAVHP